MLICVIGLIVLSQLLFVNALKLKVPKCPQGTCLLEEEVKIHNEMVHDSQTGIHELYINQSYIPPSFIPQTSSRNYKTIFGAIMEIVLKVIVGLDGYVVPIDWHGGNLVKFDKRTIQEAYKVTDPKEYPYAVLLMTESFVPLSECSGSLITDEWVLTAAHCLYDDAGNRITAVWVYAGGSSYDELAQVLDKKSPLVPGAQLIHAEEVVYHPYYPTNKVSFDIGLVKVSKKFNMTDTVNTIPVSLKPWNHTGYETCVTTGFTLVGDKEETEDEGHRTTQFLDVKKPCLCSFTVEFVAHYFQGDDTRDTLLCSKPRENHGICSGDTGVGLICEEDGVMKLKGISQRTLEFDDVNYCEISMLNYITQREVSECKGKNLVTLIQNVNSHLQWINNYTNIFSLVDLDDHKDVKPMPPPPSEPSEAAPVSSPFSLWTATAGLYLIIMLRLRPYYLVSLILFLR